MIKFIKKYFADRKARKEQIKAKSDEVILSYEILIQQYKLIQEKKSPLSKSQRDFVVRRINLAVARGHIKVDGA